MITVECLKDGKKIIKSFHAGNIMSLKAKLSFIVRDGYSILDIKISGKIRDEKGSIVDPKNISISINREWS